MRLKIKNSSLIFIALFPFLLFPGHLIAQTLEMQLQQMFGKQNVTFVDSSGFKEYYRVNVPQLIDHNDERRGIFYQRVLIGIRAPGAINVIQTEGYDIPKSHEDIHYKTELAKILDANQVIIEHRYFGSSIPDSTSKKFLTYEQASDDHHYIKQQLQHILTGKWLTTGLSKSGDAALAYRYFYPNDVDATIVYGISLTTQAEDPRFEKYLKERRGTVEGKKINDAQIYLLKNKKRLLPAFQKMLEYEHQDLARWDIETLYDYGVLELEVAFWQYYKSYDDLKGEIMSPPVTAALEEAGFNAKGKFKNFEDRLIFMTSGMVIGDIDKKMQSHYYQAFSQGGYYGYDEKPFSKYLKLKDYPLSVFAGEITTYDGSFRREEKKYTETTMEKVIFINAENDPWAVCKVIPAKDRDNLQVVAKNGTHLLTLEELPKEDFNNIKLKLNKWLDINLELD